MTKEQLFDFEVTVTNVKMKASELSKLLGVSPSTVFRWSQKGVDGGYLIVLKALKEKKITPSDIDRWLGRVSSGGVIVQHLPTLKTRETYMDSRGIKRFRDTDELAPTPNPLANWHK